MDSNQTEIVAALRSVGIAVAFTHTVSDGFPDLVVGWGGWTELVEIKDGRKPPSGRRLTKDQQAFHTAWPAKIYIIETVDDVLKFHGMLIKRGNRHEN